ncbi:MAG TPA: ABC transporter permease, partial [Acidobacteriota bacterium]
MQFWETNPLKGWTMAPVAPANFLDWQKQNTVFESMGAYFAARKEGSRGGGLADLSLTTDTQPEPVRGMFVSGSLFKVLGVPPHLGRTFHDDEMWVGKHRVVILSYGLWKRAFGMNREIIGKIVRINGRPLTVVGVMPRNFYFPDREAELWIPFGWEASEIPGMRKPHFLRAIGRLRSGVTLQQAQNEMNVIAKRLEQQYPETNQQMGIGFDLLRDFYTSEVRPRMLLVLAAVVFVLLVGCANLANLMLAQHSRRSKEISVRMAIGAGKWRLLRQFFTENLILSLMATFCGILLAVWIKDTLVAWNPGDIPRLQETALDSRVIAFALGLSFIAPILFGLLPFVRNLEFQLTETLKETNPTATVRARRTRAFLLNAQIALSLVLLSAAGLMIKSFLRLQHVNPGFDARNVITLGVSLPGLTYPDDAKLVQYYSALS